MRPARLLALAVLAAACSSTAPAQPDAGLPGPADAGGTADDGAAPGDAVDPRQPLRDRSIFANGGFETVAADGTAAHWGCQYYGAGPAPAPLCAVVTGASVEGARALRVGPGVAVWQDAAGYAQDGYLRFDLFARRATGVSAGDFYAFGMTGGTSDAWQLLAKTIDDDCPNVLRDGGVVPCRHRPDTLCRRDPG